MAKGMKAGGKLLEHRRAQKWNDKNYNKAHGISKWKSPFEMASHASGIVLKRVTVEAKQPNSACRKCVKVQLKKNNKTIVAFVPGDGNIEFIDENDRVLIAGLGRKGHAVGDIPGIRFKVVHVADIGLNALFRKKKEKPKSK